MSTEPDAEDKTIAYLNSTLLPAFGNVKGPLDSLWKFHQNNAKEKSELASAVFIKAIYSTATVSIIGLIVALAIGLFFSNWIAKILSGFASQILGSASETTAGSLQLNSASSQLSQGAAESAASIEETVSSLEELSSMVKLNSDHASEANTLSQRSLNTAESGDKEIARLISAMSDMSKSSKKIEEIINVIDDVAFQTNLLALNAAVEAARAGEQGKGFAVVADAVRNLAQRSASAAKDINALIKENVAMTQEGVAIADTSGTALKEIVTSVKKVADLNSEISAASVEQSNGIEQISKAMGNLDQAIQQNASASSEVASSSEEMSSQAACLEELVANLQLFISGGTKKHGQNKPVKAVTKLHSERKDKSFKVPTTKDVFPLDEQENFNKADGF